MGHIPLDLAGKRYGYLTPIKIVGKDNRHNNLWECQCDCGNIVITTATQIKSKNTVSCGCFRKKIIDSIGDISKTHGESKTRLYRIWYTMKRRCYDENFNRYNDYGGRGITVCDEWHKYENFAKWAKSNGYSDTLTIDRIDVNGDYCPENCRWSDYVTQSNNRRNNRFISRNGRTLTCAQWAKEIGMKASILYERLYVEHWDIERAFTEPPKSNSKAS